MMEVVKSSRFWLALAIIIAGTVMAILKVEGVEGKDVILGATGLLAGFGVAKSKKLGNGAPAEVAPVAEPAPEPAEPAEPPKEDKPDEA
jgi:hypothetical protein